MTLRAITDAEVNTCKAAVSAAVDVLDKGGADPGCLLAVAALLIEAVASTRPDNPTRDVDPALADVTRMVHEIRMKVDA